MNEVGRDLKAADALLAHLSRPEWRKKATEIFHFMDIRVIRLIVAAGQDEWIMNARRGFSGQGFRQEDFIEMFFQMRQRVAQAETGAADIRPQVAEAMAARVPSKKNSIITTTQEHGNRKVVLTDG